MVCGGGGGGEAFTCNSLNITKLSAKKLQKNRLVILGDKTFRI